MCICFWLVGGLVCNNFLKGQIVTLPCVALASIVAFVKRVKLSYIFQATESEKEWFIGYSGLGIYKRKQESTFFFLL